MTYYASISGSDIQSYRTKLTAETETGAKRQATALFGLGFRHHVIHVGELIDEGGMNERGRAIACRPIWRKTWGAIEQ